MCNFFKHEVDMVERKYKCREKIDATYIYIYSALSLDLQLWSVGIKNERSSQNRYSTQKKATIDNYGIQKQLQKIIWKM